MRWHEFIFSEQQKHKLSRHFAFWAAWCLYFLVCFILFRQPVSGSRTTPGDQLLLKTLLLVLLYVLACYPLIYLVLPKFIKGKWLQGIAYFIILCLLLFITSYILYWNVFTWIDTYRGSSKAVRPVAAFWPPVNLGLMNFAKVAVAAVSIKYVKYWWLKQKESQRLEKEKINADLQLLKAQVHPDFLFKTLNNIHTHALAASPQASEMLMRLSDLLSYMLYECDRPLVPLEKEIAMMKEYMELEKKIRNNDNPEMEINVKGDMTGKSIAPFLLQPFIENSFKYCSQMSEMCWINLDIKTEGQHFSMKLASGISNNNQNHHPGYTNNLVNVRKRLTLLYPGNHELKMTTEQEMCIVLLNINLEDIVLDPSTGEKTNLVMQGTGTLANMNLKYVTE